MSALQIRVQVPLNRWVTVPTPGRLSVAVNWIATSEGVRPVDVPGVLAARGTSGDGRVTIEVTADPQFSDNVGTWTLEAGGRVRRSSRRPDVRLDVQGLGSALLGGFAFAQLARAGRAEEGARGGLDRADALFRVGRAPWCPEIF